MIRRLALVLALAWPGAGQAQDVAELMARATEGDIAAQHALGQAYADGAGVAQNYAEAVAWFSRAAEAGHAPAQNMLGRLYFEGLGVAQDVQTALRWFRAAAESGDAQHLFDLARAIESGVGDPAAARPYYRQAADLGHDDAMVSLGVLYQNGTGVAADPGRARGLYEGPASRGHARAMNNLGLIYVRGSGVPQDYARAAELFAAAADQGLGEAMTNLGVLYENGFGVPLDEARAAELYRMGGRASQAVVQVPERVFYDPRLVPPDLGEAGLARLTRAAGAGDPVAQYQLAVVMLEQGAVEAPVLIRAAGLLRAAAEAGLAPAMGTLGLMSFRGQGVPQDYVMGHMWLVLAAAAGLHGAAEANAELSRRMTADQINDAQARAAAWSGGE